MTGLVPIPIDHPKLRKDVVMRSLTFGDKNAQWSAFVHSGTHLHVPRYFFSEAQLEALGVSLPPIETHPTRTPLDWECGLVPRELIQEIAVQRMLEAESGLVVLGCGRGKTPIASMYLAKEQVRACIVTFTTPVKTQWTKELRKLFPRLKVGGVRDSGTDIIVESAATIYSTLQRGEDIDYTSFGVVIFDECHRVAARTFNSVASSFSGKRFGLTATMERSDGLEALYQCHLGTPLVHDTDHPSCAVVSPLHTGARVGSAKDVHTALRNLLKDKDRTHMVKVRANDLVEQGHKVLVLVSLRDEVSAWVKAIRGAKEVPAGTRKKDITTRQKVLATASVCVSTYETMREGVNHPSLSALILASPVQLEGWVDQSVGRITRVHPDYPDKLVPLVVPVVDDTSAGRSMMKVIRKLCRDRPLTYEMEST